MSEEGNVQFDHNDTAFTPQSFDVRRFAAGKSECKTGLAAALTLPLTATHTTFKYFLIFGNSFDYLLDSIRYFNMHKYFI